MKKLISLILALVMCGSLCACGEKSNAIELTLDNYADYLYIWESVRSHDQVRAQFYDENLQDVHCYDKADGYACIEGTSTNYDYCNVEVTLLFVITYQTLDPNEMGWVGHHWVKDHTFSKEITIKCNIGGNGESNRFVFFEAEQGEDGRMLSYIINESLEYTCEVVSVKGTVERVS